MLTLVLLFIAFSTVHSHDENGCHLTEGGNGGGSCCGHPFIYQGKPYYQCIDLGFDKFWCPTTGNYDNDKKWGLCKFGDSGCMPTTGGNSGDAPCVFPFNYRGQQITSCTKARHNKLWCATTNDYDRDGKWGDCVPEKTACACRPCQNGGECTNEGGHHGSDGYKCACKAGFVGTNCEVKDMCASAKPCKNGATCSNTDSGYSCQCKAGFTGTNCESDVNECARNNGGCRNGGRCINTVGASRCQCSRQYTGRYCQNVNPNELVWYCAVKLNGGVRARTTDLRQAQRSLGRGSERNRQAIIPMKGRQAGDPHSLAKNWGSGGQWWMGWDDINNFRNQCRNQPIPVGK